MHMQRASMTRRLVFRDRAGRCTMIDSERFASWANPRLVCFRYQVTRREHDAPIDVKPYIDDAVTNARGIRLFDVLARQAMAGVNTVTAHIAKPEQRLTIAQAYSTASDGETVTLEVAIGVSEDATQAEAIARAARDAGYDAQLAAHLAAVEAAHRRGAVALDADLLATQGFNFGQMHLEMALCPDNPAVSVPIKGLTGEGYRFMIFWDTDFHMFHYYLLTNPAQAKNLILYRYGQLDAYRRNARAWGCRGAQVPWETGTSGEEETAPWLNLQDGELHISADVAYMVKLYDEITADPDLLVNHGAEIVFETARFYAGRVTWVAKNGRYEMLDIGCPDQYHTRADNNVFISLMARWNLAYAAGLAADQRLQAVREKIGLADSEVAEFSAIAENLYIIPPDEQGIIEEFDGFFTRSTDLRGISEMFCEHTQAVKQPDVLAAFLPFYEEYSREIQRANWHYYAARTIHGSSLSLPGMALAGALCGLTDEAADYFQRSARMDLDDVNLNSVLGVHLAGYAVLWETAVYGFGGLRPSREGLYFTPRLPRRWGGLSFTINWQGCRLYARLSYRTLSLQAGEENPKAIPVWVQRIPALISAGQKLVFRLSKNKK